MGKGLGPVPGKREQKRRELVGYLEESGFEGAIEEFHCSRCGRFLGYHSMMKGTVAVLCPGCSSWEILDINE